MSDLPDEGDFTHYFNATGRLSAEVDDLKLKLALEEASHAETIAKDNAELDRLRAQERDAVGAIQDAMRERDEWKRNAEVVEQAALAWRDDAVKLEADRDELLALLGELVEAFPRDKPRDDWPVSRRRLDVLGRARARLKPQKGGAT